MKKPSFGILLITSLASLLVVACDYESEEDARRRNRAAGDDTASGETDPNMPGACKLGAPHVGFGNEDLIAKREAGGLGIDRRRIKPFSSLEREMERVLGRKPTGLAASASAFGDAPARWYAEPVAGAVTLYTTYSVAFTSCFDMMADGVYGQMPTAETAKTECAKLQRKAWQRSPTPDETNACVDLVMTKLPNESVARRRWAHLCASVMTSNGFITY